MKKWLWNDGRLSWPLIGGVVYLTLWLLSIDLAWRLLVLPVGSLMLYAVVIGGALALMLVVAVVVMRK